MSCFLLEASVVLNNIFSTRSRCNGDSLFQSQEKDSIVYEARYDLPKGISVDDITIVIPCLNEREGIKAVVNEVRKTGFSNILALDGGSIDGTVDVAHSLGVPVILQHGKGKTAAIDSAVSIVKTEYLGLIDADGTYDPADFHKMLVYAHDNDMVVGSRLLGSRNGKKPFAAGHGVVNKIFNRLFNEIYNANLTDILSGIRILNVRAVRNVRLRSYGFGIEAELAAQILAEGGKIIEVPASFRERIGTAKLRNRDGYHILSTIARLAYEFNPLLFFLPIGAVLLLPGLGILSYVAVDSIALNGSLFHSGWAIAGLGLCFTGIQLMGFSLISFLMKRIEYRQLRAIRNALGKTSVAENKMLDE